MSKELLEKLVDLTSMLCIAHNTIHDELSELRKATSEIGLGTLEVRGLQALTQSISEECNDIKEVERALIKIINDSVSADTSA